MCVCVSLTTLVCLSISVWISLSLFVYIYVFIPVCLPLCLPTCLCVCACVPASLSVYLGIESIGAKAAKRNGDGMVLGKRFQSFAKRLARSFILSKNRNYNGMCDVLDRGELRLTGQVTGTAAVVMVTL